MIQQDLLYTMALARLTSFNSQVGITLYRALGGGRGVWEHRHDLRDVLPDCSERLATMLAQWDAPLARAEQELVFAEQHHISVLCLDEPGYPQRLTSCADTPLVLYYMGSADLDTQRVVSIVGTRRATPYGQDLIRHFVSDLRRCCPGVLVVSGLAYGVDICAHRQALQEGLPTVGVLAHGLDDIYPPRHRDTAAQMVRQGGLLTEYMSHAKVDRLNFVRRNRIVAGMADATVLVESAAHGGGLITCRIALDYGRHVMAFPGPVGAPYSEGCNNLIRDGGAQLITSSDDFVAAMGWQSDAQRQQARRQGIERQLFPDLSEEERHVVEVLGSHGDLQQNQLAVMAGIDIGRLTGLLFQLEMKGVVRSMAGGCIHLLA